MLSFDPSVSIGTILNIVGLIVAAVTLYGRTSKTLAIFEVNYKNALERLDRIEGDVEKLTKITEIIASQKERIMALDKRFDDLISDLKDRRSLVYTKAEVENFVNTAISEAVLKNHPKRIRAVKKV